MQVDWVTASPGNASMGLISIGFQFILTEEFGFMMLASVSKIHILDYLLLLSHVLSQVYFAAPLLKSPQILIMLLKKSNKTINVMVKVCQ